MLYILLLLIFIEVILIIIGINSYFKQRKTMGRLDRYLKTEQEFEIKSKKKSTRRNYGKVYNSLGKSIMKLLSLDRYRDKIDMSLIRADIPLMPEELLFIMSVFSISIFFIGFVISRSLVVSILIAISALIIFRLVIKSKVKKRLNIINVQLGDALDMFAASLRAGHSFTQAMGTAANEMPLPISKELSRVVREIELGLSIEKALANLLERVPSDDLGLLITAVLIQRQIGGNLAEIIDNISETIRQRIRLNGEVKTLTAQGRISGWIVGLLPIGLILVISIISPFYMKTLFTDRLGHIMLGMGIFNEIIALILIKKIINIEY